MSAVFGIIAAILGATGVAIGAFGAHGLAAYFAANPTLESSFRTASTYHMYHALAVFAAAWVADRWPGPAAAAGGWMLIAGAVIFCGSLYLLSLTNTRWMGAIAPIGGTLMILGWAALGVAVWQGRG
jgi:uncharacterized membrane protein YgdD (TMEM256/DUF423 family)